MHHYNLNEILTAVSNQTLLILAAAQAEGRYWDGVKLRYHEIIGMLEIAHQLQAPALLIASLEHHRDQLCPAREAE